MIALDPGHNGGNAAHASEIAKKVWIGTAWKPCNKVGTSTTGGYPEHAFTFDVAKRVKASLEHFGATVHMTRTTDTGVGPCINVRGGLGATVHADLAVSIHADGAGSSNRGFFVMKPGVVVGWTDDIAARSGVLAAAIRNGLTDAGLPIANYYATNGIKTRTDLGTLNCSDVPVVEIELGNMKNATDAARMSSRGRADAVRQRDRVRYPPLPGPLNSAGLVGRVDVLRVRLDEFDARLPARVRVEAVPGEERVGSLASRPRIRDASECSAVPRRAAGALRRGRPPSPPLPRGAPRARRR